jgi:hypothetical protein
MTCWTVLGLPDDADKRSIKRQYASLLKQHRPDEDPEGFQRLREAYEQALQWADWRMQEEQDEAPALLDEAPLQARLQTPMQDPQTCTDAPSPARQLAEQCLESISSNNLKERLDQARRYDCERQFEHALLEYCLAGEEPGDLTDAAIEQLHWLTLWQHDDLPGAAMEQLRERLMERAAAQLTANVRDQQRFTELARSLDAAPWLQTLDGRQWLTERLAITLLQAPVWSQRLFDAVCARQGWKQTGQRSACPEPWWSQLLARSHRETFREEQLRLAQSVDTSECRAARMLFRPMNEDSRVQLSMSFSEADWNACEALYRTVQFRYPELLDEVSQLDPEGWRPLRRATSVLPVPVAIVVTSAGLSWFNEYQLGGAFYTSVADMLLRALLLMVLGLGLAALCKRLAQRTWRLDNWLNARCGRWLSLRRPTPLPIRESLWVWLLAALIYLIGGLWAAATYVGVLAVMAAWSRRVIPEHWVHRVYRIGAIIPRTLLPGVLIGALVPLVLLGAALSKNQPLGVNQGLQAWPQRVCAARQATATPCPEGFSRSQWYKTDAQQVSRP